MQAQKNIMDRLNFNKILLILAMFLFALFATSTHAHDLHTENGDAPDHHICSVCLIATEFDSDTECDNDDKDGDDDNPLHRLVFGLPCDVIDPGPIGSINLPVPRPRQTALPYLLSRAPPLELHSKI